MSATATLAEMIRQAEQISFAATLRASMANDSLRPEEDKLWQEVFNGAEDIIVAAKELQRGTS